MQLVTRIAAVMRALEGQSTGRSLGQIAKATGLPRPTVQRLVDALRAEGFVALDPAHGGVRLGGTLARMAGSVRTDLVAFARPLLESLARDTQEMAALSVLRDGHAVVVALVEVPERGIMLTAHVGAAWPIHCTADGKALIADLPPAALEGMLPSPLPRRTARTQTSLMALRAELDEVARSGLAADEEGTTEGICALAARIVDAAGVRYAVSVIMPAGRFQASRAAIAAAVLRCRTDIERAVGLPSSDAGGSAQSERADNADAPAARKRASASGG